MYISLSTAGGWESGRGMLGGHGGPNEPPGGDPAHAPESSRNVPLHRALAQSPLVVVGDPGMGKTTFLRRVAFALAQTRLGEDPHAAEIRLGVTDRTFPVLLRLADLADFLDPARSGSDQPATRDGAAWLPRFLTALGRGSEVRYWHLTFQEFLAARAVASRLEDEQRQILLGEAKRIYDPEWREVALLLGGILHQQGRAKVDGLFRDLLDDLGPNAELADAVRAAGLLGSMLRDLEPFQYRPGDARYHVLMATVTQIFDQRRASSVPIETRIQAADALGQAGDTRLDTRRDDYWVEVPAGKFRMGFEKGAPDAQDAAMPAHLAQLDAFRIARYPVTVGQYQQFVEQEGYAEERWWTEGGFGQFSQPDDWEQQLQFPSRPVTGINWFEANAFCAWAGYRLPTEAEWERAARGKQGRPFPWGDEPADASRLNFAGDVGHATPVGIYPLGNTPEGICDMAGNVLEWCSDWFAEDYYQRSPKKNPKGPDKGEYRVLRGGAWYDQAGYCHAAVRFRDFSAGGRYVIVGFRLCVSRQNSFE